MADSEHVAKLRDGVKAWNAWRMAHSGVVPDLKGAALSGADLSGTDLSGADLSGAELIGATLRRVDLKAATLIGADLSGADLGGANLRNATLSRAELSGVDLSKADLGGAHLNDANLIGATLSKADLCRASLIRADLSGADLDGTNLMEADLRDAELSHSSLAMANLAKATLSGARMDYANLLGWKIPGVICTYLVRGDRREIIRFQPTEFENKYRQNCQLFEIILDVEFSELAYFVGLFIAKAVNAMSGTGIVQLKTLDAVSKERTRFVFITSDIQFLFQKKDLIQTMLRSETNRLIATIEKPRLLYPTNAMKYTLNASEEKIEGASPGLAEDEDSLRKSETVPGRYDVYLGKLEQTIWNIVFSTLRQSDSSPSGG